METEGQTAETQANTAPPPAPEAPANDTPSQDTATQTNGEKPAGFDPVDFKTATPEQIEARFKRVYDNMQRYNRDSKELRQANQALVEMVGQLSAGQQQIVNHIQTTNFVDAETNLRAERDAAWNKGDVKAFNDANDKLSEIRVEKKLLEKQPKPQPVRQAPEMQDGRINNPRIETRLPDADAAIVNSWMAESDQGGTLKRPWTNSGDPRNYAAALEAQAVFNSPLFADKPLAEKLKEIDKRMGVQTQSAAGQNVLPSGNLTGKRTNNTIQLDPKIEQVAIRTKFAAKNPKLTPQQRSALTDQDHVDAYKEAVRKSQSRGAKR